MTGVNDIIRVKYIYFIWFFIEIIHGKTENRKKIRKRKITIDRLDEGKVYIQDVERYGVIMFVSFSVGNTGPFKDHNPCGEFEKRVLRGKYIWSLWTEL